jgi:ADP-dependent glucokinase
LIKVELFALFWLVHLSGLTLPFAVALTANIVMMFVAGVALMLRVQLHGWLDAWLVSPEARAFAKLSELAAEAAPRARTARLAFGYNANLDAVSNATTVLAAVRASEHSSATIVARDFVRIETAAELLACFAHFFAIGAAAERHVESRLFDRVVALAIADATHTALSPGGNAALMANAAARAGADVLLGGPIGARLRPLLHGDIRTVSAAGDASPQDQVHLILEYGVGDRFGELVATRANRFILHSDNVNGRIEGLDDFHAAARQFQPHAIVAAGLHLLQEQPHAFRSQRVDDVRRQLEAMPAGVLTHFEFASIGERAFTAEVTRALLASVDSIGFNEQELGDIYASVGGAQWPPEHFAKAPRDAVVPALVFLFDLSERLYRDALLAGRAARLLSRIHFHYLAYHIVAVREDGVWQGGREAVAAGSLAVTLAACSMSETAALDSERVELRASDTSVKSERAELADGRFVWLHTAPVLVCRKPLRTVGLGDVVSSTALATMEFNK